MADSDITELNSDSNIWLEQNLYLPDLITTQNTSGREK